MVFVDISFDLLLEFTKLGVWGFHSCFCFAFFCLFVFLVLHGKNNAILARQMFKWHIVSLPVAFPASGDPSSF